MFGLLKTRTMAGFFQSCQRTMSCLSSGFPFPSSAPEQLVNCLRERPLPGLHRFPFMTNETWWRVDPLFLTSGASITAHFIYHMDCTSDTPWASKWSIRLCIGNSLILASDFLDLPQVDCYSHFRRLPHVSLCDTECAYIDASKTDSYRVDVKLQFDVNFSFRRIDNSIELFPEMSITKHHSLTRPDFNEWISYFFSVINCLSLTWKLSDISGYLSDETTVTVVPLLIVTR